MPSGVTASSSVSGRQLMIDTVGYRRRKEGRTGLPGQKNEYQKYAPLLKAALRGDWETAKKFFDQDPDAITAPITRELESALYMAIGTGPVAIKFVAEYLKLLPAEALVKRDIAGNTPLHLGAAYGNTRAAAFLVKKNPGLLCLREDQGWLPVHFAAIYAQKETLSYLLWVTYKDDAATRTLFFSPGSEPSGTELLIHVITSEFYDLALDLVHRHPELATSLTPNGNDSGLGAIARKAQAFPSGTHLNLWERIIYAHVPVELENYAKDPCAVEIENPPYNTQFSVKKDHWARFKGKTFSVLWKVLALLVPQMKNIQKQKQMHHHASQLVRCLLKEVINSNDLSMHDSLETKVVISAARLGIPEFLEEIVELIPKLAWARDSEYLSLFQWAVIERHENVFNLIYQMTSHQHCATMDIDQSGNNMLHLAGRLAPFNKLNLVSGAALQMQRELQWFKEVEKWLGPTYIEMRNIQNETPAMVFSREHKDLLKTGGEWMKNTASSCTISAALIVTITFAAVITVPGGNHDSDGIPILSKEIAFTVFIASNALSLFASTTSLLLFLSILTMRLAEGDFLHVLPKRLIMGLVTLFLSITTMIVAFSSALCLLLRHKTPWMLLPVFTLACFPITSFMLLQFPLLVELISSTYGRGIFGKQNDKQFF